jgi:DNA-binding NarL/FixJ family response regulator
MGIAVFSYERLTPSHIVSFINLGAASYVDLRVDNGDEIEKAFSLIVRGKLYLPCRIEAVLDKYGLESSDYSRLNKSEITVLRLSALGNSIEDIAVKLEIEAGTVRNHISSIHKKFNIHSHTELVGLSLRIGIVRPGELVTEAINVKILEGEEKFSEE